MTDEAEPAKEKAPKGPVLTMKMLTERVVKAIGGKPKEVRATIEAAVKEMGAAMKSGESMRLPAFGITRVINAADADTGKVLRMAIRPMKEKERPVREPKPKPERPARAPKAARAGKGGKAAARAKEALAAPEEAE